MDGIVVADDDRITVRRSNKNLILWAGARTEEKRLNSLANALVSHNLLLPI